MLELRHLRAFLAVAEELHFGRAAARLAITQPGLSQQVQGLEAALGVTLFDRARRRVALTPAGRVLLAEAPRLTAQVDRVADLTRRAASGQVGRLVIGSAQSATYEVLPRLLSEYRRAHPGVDLDLREMNSPLQIEALRAGQIDVAFVRTPVDTGKLATHPLREEQLMVVLPRRHPLARQARVTLRALAREPLILHPVGPRPNWSDFMIGLARGVGVEPTIAEQASETSVAMSFVAAGLGLTVVPDSFSALRHPATVLRPLAGAVPRTRLLVVHRPDHVAAALTPLLALVARLYPRS